MEKKNLMKELEQGRDFTRQLQVHLNLSSSSKEVREFLVQKILSSYEKALSLLSFSSTMADHPQQFPNVGINLSDSPFPTFDESPRSEDSDFDLKDPDHKRKNLQILTKKVKVSSGIGLEGPLDDEYTWRKYGQKDILGSKYPRGYHRCSNRNLKGCLATKQVQRSDEDPAIFDVTYRGPHTCNQIFRSPENLDPLNQSDQNQVLESFNIVTDDTIAGDPPSESFTPIQFASSSNAISENRIDAGSANFAGDFSFAFGDFQQSSKMNSFSRFYDDSELSKVVLPPTSSSGSRTLAMEFPVVDQAKFDPNFTFDNSDFFS